MPGGNQSGVVFWVWTSHSLFLAYANNGIIIGIRQKPGIDPEQEKSKK